MLDDSPRSRVIGALQSIERLLWRIRKVGIVLLLAFCIVVLLGIGQALLYGVWLDGEPAQITTASEAAQLSVLWQGREYPIPMVVTWLFNISFYVIALFVFFAMFRIVMRRQWRWFPVLLVWPLVWLYLAFGPDIPQGEM